MFEEFQRFRGYTLVQGFVICGNLDGPQGWKCFKGFESFSAFSGFNY